MRQKNYQVTSHADHYEIRNPNGPVLGMAEPKLKEADGLVFKNLSGSEALGLLRIPCSPFP